MNKKRIVRMKEMTLREVQLFGLDILSDVNDFCTQNGINYSLSYGTLLGAVRHKGFIPWDDDIDIVMPRPDYERFCRSFHSANGFEVFSPIMHNSYLGYARVCDLSRTWVHSMPWCEQSPTGMWIDIFPIDGVDIKTDSERERDYLRELERKRLYARMPKDNLMRPMPFTRRCKTIAKKIVFFFSNVEKIVDEYDKYISSIDYNTSDFCGNRAILTYYNKETYPRAYFDSYVDIEFEGRVFKTISNYDDLLRTLYGDYMQLPPIEERVRHPQEMYWYE